MTLWLAIVLFVVPQPAAPATRAAGASISGTIYSDDATPVPVRHALVELNGPARQSVVTGDNGTFVFGNLAAGRYVITADKLGVGHRAFSANLSSPAPTAIVLAPGQELTGLRVVLPRGAVIAGRITDAAGAPIGGALVAAIDPRPLSAQESGTRPPASAQSDDDGNYRIFGVSPGHYLIRVSPASAPTAKNSRLPALVESYFPAAALQRDADSVSVAAREERLGVDISVQQGLRVEVSGTVRDSAGQAIETSVSLARAGAAAGQRELMFFARGGVFTFDGVSPGSYVLRASYKNVGSGEDRPMTLTAIEPVEVSGRDQTGLALIARPPVALSGQASIAAMASGAAAPQLALVHGDEVISATVHGDGTFEFAGVAPGTYFLKRVPEPGASRWLVEDATLDGRDVLGEPIEIGARPISGLAVSLTSDFGGMRGRISTGSGAGAPELAIVVIGVDRKKWGIAAGRPIVVWPDTNGDWSIDALAAGNYYVAALGAVSPDDLGHTEFLEAVANASVTVGVKAGVIAVQDLKVK